MSIELNNKERLPNNRTRIEVIYAGGTISSLATPSGYREGGHFVDLIDRLEERFPGFTKRFDLGQPQIAYIGLSENIEESDLEMMESAIDTALAREPDSIVMSFGTDFAEQAAKRFQEKYKEQLHQKGVKIIIVSANHDLSHPQTDAWDNLTFSFESAEAKAEPAVYLGFHRRLIPAELATKEPYNGQEMNFRSTEDPEYIEAISKQKEREAELIASLKAEIGENPQAAQGVVEYSVNVFRLNHQVFFDYLKDKAVKAVLLTLYHSGTANTNDSEASVSRLVNYLRSRGIISFGVTENGEPVDLHSYETSVKLREAGVVPLYDMQKEVALAKLQMIAYGTSEEIISKMLSNKVGEITEDKIIKDNIENLKTLYSISGDVTSY